MILYPKLTIFWSIVLGLFSAQQLSYGASFRLDDVRPSLANHVSGVFGLASSVGKKRLLSAQCVSSIGQIIKSVCVSVSQ